MANLINGGPPFFSVGCIKPRVSSGKQVTARGTHQRAHVIRIRIFAEAFGPHRVRIVPAYAFVGGEPDDLFSIHKDAEDMIRTERSTGPFEGELLDRFSILKVK